MDDVLLIWESLADALKKENAADRNDAIIVLYSSFELLLSNLALISYQYLWKIANSKKPAAPNSATGAPVLEQLNLSNTNYFRVTELETKEIVPNELKEFVLQCIADALKNNKKASVEFNIPNNDNQSIRLLQQLLWDHFKDILKRGNNTGTIYIRQHYANWVVELKGDEDFMQDISSIVSTYIQNTQVVPLAPPQIKGKTRTLVIKNYKDSDPDENETRRFVL